jgi:uncharacterized membrane protein
MNEGSNARRSPIGFSRFQAVIVLLMFAAGAILYPRLPERIPMHWDIHGQINGWGDRNFWNVFFPGFIALGMVILGALMPRIDPMRRSYARFRGSYYFILDLIVAFLALLHALTLYAAFHTEVKVGVLVPIGVGLLLAVIGNQLGKIKRNFFMGIRTPWTLASETVWVRTHRIAGRLFVVAGLISAAAAFLPPPWNFIAFMVLILGASMAASVISYFIYHRLESTGKLRDKIQEPEAE